MEMHKWTSEGVLHVILSRNERTEDVIEKFGEAFRIYRLRQNGRGEPLFISF